MAIEMKESFQVAAPIDKVWEFMMKPERVVACMPGAGLKEADQLHRLVLANVDHRYAETLLRHVT